MGKLSLILPGVFLMVAVLTAFASPASDNSLEAKEEASLLNALSEENIFRGVRSAAKKNGNNRNNAAKNKKRKSKRKGGKRMAKKGGKRMSKKNNKRGMKSSKKNKKRSKKTTRKNKKGSKKSSRKNKKAQKKKAKKTKKAGKTVNKGNRNSGRDTATCKEDCVKAVAAFGQLNTKASFYNQQAGRAINFAAKITKKGGKKGEFKDPLDLALGSAGGNKTSLKCLAGNSDEIKKVIDTLDACSTSIETACNQTVEAATLTKLEKCFNSTKLYREKYQQLLAAKSLTTDQICINTNNTEITDLSKEIESSCDTASAEDKALKKMKTACNKAFIDCRTEERKVAKEMNTCMTPRKTTPVKSTSATTTTKKTTSAAAGAAVAELNALNVEKAAKEEKKKREQGQGSCFKSSIRRSN